VQQAFYACGLALPRDSDQQMAFGRPLAVDETLGGLERNDLVFWAGHVGVMVDAKTLLHANAGAMSVALEDLSDAVARIKAAGSGPPIGFRRLCEGPSG
jgi:cell wall-associated NlpC family hydrolase